jgi:hypothetical protein
VQAWAIGRALSIGPQIYRPGKRGHVPAEAWAAFVRGVKRGEFDRA